MSKTHKTAKANKTHSEEVDGAVSHIAALLVLEGGQGIFEAGGGNGADLRCLGGCHETGFARGGLLGEQSEQHGISSERLFLCRVRLML